MAEKISLDHIDRFSDLSDREVDEDRQDGHLRHRPGRLGPDG